MSEMLGNQFFLARRYSDACAELENEYYKYPTNLSVLKKLIICYLQTGQTEKAFSSFYSLVKQNVETIIDTDLARDDFPCPEIIETVINDMKSESTDDQNIKLGILWLYCDKKVSVDYLSKVSPENKNHSSIKEIINIINRVTTKTNQELL
ncbi:MAG: hypothetical protein U5K00_04495 [Melioribacteraceae bacterium]|nr:hypothetical protein [Melioribacteraceae bacterium]